MTNITEEFFRTGIYKPDYTTYGGEISLLDFEGHRTLVDMANKIASDFRFDKRCCKMAYNYQKYGRSII